MRDPLPAVSAGLQHVFEVARRVQALLDGTAASPAHQGLTTAEERSSCSIPQVLSRTCPQPRTEGCEPHEPLQNIGFPSCS